MKIFLCFCPYLALTMYLLLPFFSDVDYKDGDFEFGRTSIYEPNFLLNREWTDNSDNEQDRLTEIGVWWWDWAIQRGSDYQIFYGTMMIEWNRKESIAFGFSSTQDYYAITGGYLEDNACPNGYVRFDRSTQNGDVRFYELFVCGGC